MTPKQLEEFFNKYGLSSIEFAELLGVSRMAVDHWLAGDRTIAKPYGRLIRLFDRKPELMKEFGR